MHARAGKYYENLITTTQQRSTDGKFPNYNYAKFNLNTRICEMQNALHQFCISCALC